MSATIDEQFIDYIVKSLVGNPDKVEIKRTIDEKGVLLELTVDPEDLGRVIGKRGATAQSLRTLLRALGTKNDARYNLKIVDNGAPRPERAPREENNGGTVSEDSWTSSKADEPSEKPSEESAPAEPQAEETPAAQEPAEEVPAEEPETDAASESSDSVSRTRKELADLDDLDI